MNEETKPNAGEKCPICEGKRRAKNSIGYCQTCYGTGFKPAEDPEHKMKCGVCGEEFDMRRLDEVAFHETHKLSPDIQYFGFKKISPAADVKELSEQEVKSHYAILKAMNDASDFAFRSKSGQSRDYEIAHWHLSDLTTKLATLQVENERLNIINNRMVDNLKMWQSANAVFDKEITTLHIENQELVKEVVRLRELLKLTCM